MKSARSAAGVAGSGGVTLLVGSFEVLPQHQKR